MILSLLPATLLSLLFASPALATPTSSNDPLRALVLKAPKQPEPPICCLKPLTPLEPVDDEILLSFEEWKAKQLAMQVEAESKPKPKLDSVNQSAPTVDNGGAPAAPGEANARSEPIAPPPDGSVSPPPLDVKDLSPHFRVPITDRFNYANLDCSARVHMSHRSAKSSASILSSKKDRYMLSPCKTKDRQFVVVELCDDVRIDTVQLANFEFFSGVFKDFTVSVAKTYTTDPEGWTTAGVYRAKNVRGVQSFHPPTSLRDFYRYIRIDFHSHYGSEYYCPVSLLRVYGLTHLEEWKWEVWEAESRAKLEKNRRLPPVEVVETVVATTTIAREYVPQESNHPSSQTNTIHETPAISSSTSSQAATTHTSSSTIVPSASSSSNVHTSSPNIHVTVASSDVTSSTQSTSQTQQATSSDHPTPSSKSSAQVTTSSTESSTHSDADSPSNHTPPPPPSSHTSSGSPSIIVSAASPSVAVIPIPLPPATNGGESVYRTITNRLAAVENNQTLYMRYIEQQTSAIRDVIKRLGEDLGRLEGINRAQTATYQRTFKELENQRYQLQMEYGDILERIELLSQEIILEKRLGVAQLCLLLAVLIFLALTRGSRAETYVKPLPMTFNRSVREWGKRHLSMSSEWVGPFKKKDSLSLVASGRTSRDSSPNTSRTRTPGPVSRNRPFPLRMQQHGHQASLDSEDTDTAKIAFPSGSTSSSSRREPHQSNQTQNQMPSTAVPPSGRNRTRTISGPKPSSSTLRSAPISRRAQYVLQRPVTPTKATFRPPLLQRSSSQGGAALHLISAPGMPQSASWGSAISAPPKSAKKWARTAHLHEVKSAKKLGKEKERENEDVFSSVPRTSRPPPTAMDKQPLRSVENEDAHRRRLDDGGGFLRMSEKEREAFVDGLLLRPEGGFNGSPPGVVEESDPWVDTDRESADGSEQPVLDISSPPRAAPAVSVAS